MKSFIYIVVVLVVVAFLHLKKNDNGQRFGQLELISLLCNMHMSVTTR